MPWKINIQVDPASTPSRNYWYCIDNGKWNRISHDPIGITLTLVDGQNLFLRKLLPGPNEKAVPFYFEILNDYRGSVHVRPVLEEEKRRYLKLTVNDSNNKDMDLKLMVGPVYP